jgi:hypothetical protein
MKTERRDIKLVCSQPWVVMRQRRESVRGVCRPSEGRE